SLDRPPARVTRRPVSASLYHATRHSFTGPRSLLPNRSRRAIETERGLRRVNPRILITVGAAIALAAPSAAIAKVVPIKDPAKKVAQHVVKRHVVPRVLCICVTIPVTPESEAVIEARIDAEMIAHGLDPIYGPTLANTALQTQYDALQIA